MRVNDQAVVKRLLAAGGPPIVSAAFGITLSRVAPSLPRRASCDRTRSPSRRLECPVHTGRRGEFLRYPGEPRRVGGVGTLARACLQRFAPRPRPPIPFMRPHPNTEGKILPSQVNNEGDRRIEQRAQELAEIRGSGSYTQEDLAEAARELRGHSLPVSSPEDDVAETGLGRDPSDPAANTGHHVPDMPADDENEASARLAQEGVDEAQHDLMLAARRRRENP